MPTDINFNKKLGISKGSSIILPSGPSFDNTYSMLFEGIDETVSMGDVLDMANDGSDAYSISVWFKFTDNTSATLALVAKQKATAWFNGYSIAVRGDLKRLSFWLGTFQGGDAIRGYATIPTINDGNWHHVVLTYDGSQDISGFTLYYDDSSQSITTETNNIPVNVANAEDFMIGARGNAGGPALVFDGNIDEVSYFTSELSAADVTDIYNGGVPTDLSSLNPVGWWRMGDAGSWNGSKWLLTDQGSGGNDGNGLNMVFANRQADVP